MPKKKGYTKPQIKAFLRTPFGGDNSKFYDDMVLRTGKTRDAIYQQHKRLHSKNSSARTKSAPAKVVLTKPNSAPPTPIPMQKGDDIQAYVLENLDSSWAVRSDTAEIIEKLEPIIDAMEIGQGTPFYTVNQTSVRRWLTQEKEKTGKVFTIKTIRDNETMKRIVRKQ